MYITKKIIRDLSKLCYISYYDYHDMKKIYYSRPLTKKYNFLYNYKNKFKFISNEQDCQVYITKHNNILLSIFRGTDSLIDIKHNINITRKHMPIPNIDIDNYPLIHEGFLQKFDSIKKNIDLEIQKYSNIPNTNKQIIFCGYSLGALSLLVSTHFMYKYNIQIHCITFGCPRVGNKQFVKLYNKKILTSLFNIILLGDSLTGKTAFCRRYIDGNFDTYYQATNNIIKNTTAIRTNYGKYKINLYDTPGS